eukprot:654789-Amphidinium_carterae.1
MSFFASAVHDITLDFGAVQCPEIELPAHSLWAPARVTVTAVSITAPSSGVDMMRHRERRD